MAQIPSNAHRDANERLREILSDADLPAPDEVIHLSRSVVFKWHDTKAAVVVDLDDYPVGDDDLAGPASAGPAG